MKNPISKKGFTLTELLVVIVIVATLAALGFAGARRGLMAARAATTITNLKQIGTAVHAIREEGLRGDAIRPGTFPPYAGQLSGPWKKFNILELIAEKQGYCTEETTGYKWTVMPSETILQNPLSERKFGGDAKTPAEINLSSNSDQCHGSYSYNALLEGWLSTANVPATGASGMITRMDGVNRQNREILHPALTIMMGEKDDKSNTTVYTGWTGMAPQGNYKNGAHCVFVDNHVERVSNTYLKTAEGQKKHMQLTWR